MAYEEIPRDVLKIKRRVVAGLTKRQLVCILIAAAIGLPLFFLLRKPLGSSTAAYVMVFAMIPAMLFAFYEHNGLPLERYLRDMLRVMFFRSKQRPYRTENYYERLNTQIKYEEEVRKIVSDSNKRKRQKTTGFKKKRLQTSDTRGAGRSGQNRAQRDQGRRSAGGSSR